MALGRARTCKRNQTRRRPSVLISFRASSERSIMRISNKREDFCTEHPFRRAVQSSGRPHVKVQTGRSSDVVEV